MPHGPRRFLLISSALALLTTAFTTAGCATLATTGAVAARVSGAQRPRAHRVSPTMWPMYADQPGHNAVRGSVVAQQGGESGAPQWSFAVPGAIAPGAALTPAQAGNWAGLVGFAAGVSMVGTSVYASNNNGFVYDLGLRTGRARWAFNAHNQVMTTPLVFSSAGQRIVVVGVGNTNFSYSQALRFQLPGATATRGTGFSAIDAISAASGKLVWSVPTVGEDMPTPILVGRSLVFADGAGHVEALNPANGQVRWRTTVGSFDSMSSLNRVGTTVVFGGTNPNRLYGIDAHSGTVLWTVHPAEAWATSTGDGTPAVHGTTVITQVETRSPQAPASLAATSPAATSPAATSPTPASAPGSVRVSAEELAVNGMTGKVAWTRQLGVGMSPPGNRSANAMVSANTVYTASSVGNEIYALNASTGAVQWKAALDAHSNAAPTLIGGRLLVPTSGGTMVTLNAATGALLRTWTSVHGGYGPQNLVVVGATAFIGTNFGWMQAIPLRTLTG